MLKFRPWRFLFPGITLTIYSSVPHRSTIRAGIHLFLFLFPTTVGHTVRVIRMVVTGPRLASLSDTLQLGGLTPFCLSTARRDCTETTLGAAGGIRPPLIS